MSLRTIRVVIYYALYLFYLQLANANYSYKREYLLFLVSIYSRWSIWH
nr:MAG TPA: hypothetical protein [Caudoviricetes sp.]